MYALQAIEVSKSFGTHKALENVTIEVDKQSIFGLLGPNGAGKTTLIRIINLITARDEGTVLLAGKPVKPEDIRHIGYLPEERGLYKKMKVGEQAIYLARLKGMTRHEATKALTYWFEKFGITSWWNKKVEELSKGMAQKVQFIVTVLHKPKLLIFDEPFSGFDPINVNILKDEILNLRDEGATVIFSTHNMASVEELCDHIALINNSRMILSGEIMDIKNRFKQHIFEISYHSPRNLIFGDGSFSLVGSVVENGLKKVHVRINDHSTSNQLLQFVMQQAEINTFREILPSVNEIFIQEVNRTKR